MNRKTVRTLYLFITDTLADWEPGHVLAELRSGRYLKDPALKFNVVLCGGPWTPLRQWVEYRSDRICW
jgi:hypothetical protein